jgi:Amidase
VPDYLHPPAAPCARLETLTSSAACQGIAFMGIYAIVVSLVTWCCRLNRDTIGIIARTVEDTARVLGAVAGYDQSDPQTKLVQTQAQPDDWTYFLDKHGYRQHAADRDALEGMLRNTISPQQRCSSASQGSLTFWHLVYVSWQAARCPNWRIAHLCRCVSSTGSRAVRRSRQRSEISG